MLARRRRTSKATVNRLLKLTLVSPSSRSGGSEVYTLNDTGRAVLRRPALAGELHAALQAGQPFAIGPDDRIAAMPQAQPIVPVMLAGSHRRGSGSLVHAMLGPFDWNHPGPALCGAKPGGRSAGFAPMPHLTITCGKCTRKLIEQGLEPGSPPTS